MKSFSSLRNLGFKNLRVRNPVPKQEKNPVLGSYVEKFQLPPKKSLLKVQIKRLIDSSEYTAV